MVCMTSLLLRSRMQMKTLHYPSINIIIIAQGAFLPHLSPECLTETSVLHDRSFATNGKWSEANFCWTIANNETNERKKSPPPGSIGIVCQSTRKTIALALKKKSDFSHFDDFSSIEVADYKARDKIKERKKNSCRFLCFKNNQLISTAVDIEFYANCFFELDDDTLKPRPAYPQTMRMRRIEYWEMQEKKGE